MEILAGPIGNCKNTSPKQLIEKPILLNFELQVNSALDAVHLVANAIRILLGTDRGGLTETKLELIC